MSLFDHDNGQPGIRAVTRNLADFGAGLKKLRAGEIAVINSPDMSYAAAQKLAAIGPKAVINAASFLSGAIPVHGAQLLQEAGIIVADQFGAEVWEGIKDGKKATLSEEGVLSRGSKIIGRGRILDPAEIARLTAQGGQFMVDNMEAFFGNTVQFIETEAPMIIDGFGVPTPEVDMDGRKVVVASPNYRLPDQLEGLRNFMREYEPVLIAVDDAASVVLSAGYTPDIILGNPGGIDSEALKCGARVIIPADTAGHAQGLERLQDLGIGALTFPAVTNCATDLALLLADTHGASVIVSAGASLRLEDYVRRIPQATPSAWLTRTKLGDKLVGADTVAELYNVNRPPNLTWLWIIIGLVVVAAVVVAIVGFAGSSDVVTNLHAGWANFQQLVGHAAARVTSPR